MRKFRNSSKDEARSTEINAIAEVYKLDPNDKLIRAWKKLGKLNKFAHKTLYARPRGIDDNFQEISGMVFRILFLLSLLLSAKTTTDTLNTLIAC